MANLRAIRKRINSVKNTRQITRAMKMVSGAKFRRAEERVRNFRPYAQGLAEVVEALVSRDESLTHPLFDGGVAGAPPLYVLVTSDRGLCGAFNANVFKELRYHFEDERIDPDDCVFFGVGRKAVEYLRRRGWNLLGGLDGLPEPPDPATVARLADAFAEAFTTGVVGSVTVIYNEFVNALTQRVVRRRLLPLARPETPPKVLVPPLAAPQRAELFAELVPQLFDAQVEAILLDSLAGEHGARMTAMDAASTNASEMINRLTLSFNRARQAAITAELLDIINGKNAIE